MELDLFHSWKVNKKKNETKQAFDDKNKPVYTNVVGG